MKFPYLPLFRSYFVRACSFSIFYLFIFFFSTESSSSILDALAPYLFVICLDYVLWISIDLIKENGVVLKKTTKSIQYAAETMTDADYADDLVLLANTPTQAESLLHSFEQAARGIGLLCVLNKMEPSPL